MSGTLRERLLVVVGAGGVGKTSLAAALGLRSARSGDDTLVMTFDPSLRLKDALGVGDAAREQAVRVAVNTPGRLDVALLDARSTFDRLIQRYSPDRAAAERIYTNRFYHELAGNLAGILEYMAVERLFEVAREGKYRRIILDTPPTRQALDFLEAPNRIVSFLDSGAVKLALKPWWEGGGVRAGAMRLAAKGAQGIADRVLGRRLLIDLVEFFRAFAPLYAGFRQRATEVQALLREPDTVFLLVSGPGADRIPDTMFFARKLQESGHRLGPVVVNQVHPDFTVPHRPARTATAAVDGVELFHYLGQRDQRGIIHLRKLLSKSHPLVTIPLQPIPPISLADLEQLGELFHGQLSASLAVAPEGPRRKR